MKHIPPITDAELEIMRVLRDENCIGGGPEKRDR
jgi:hypothetical protein